MRERGRCPQRIPGVVTRMNASFSSAPQEQIDSVASQDLLILQDGLPIVGARGIQRDIIDLDQRDVGKPIKSKSCAGLRLVRTDTVGDVINLITHEPTHAL